MPCPLGPGAALPPPSPTAKSLAILVVRAVARGEDGQRHPGTSENGGFMSPTLSEGQCHSSRHIEPLVVRPPMGQDRRHSAQSVASGRTTCLELEDAGDSAHFGLKRRLRADIDQSGESPEGPPGKPRTIRASSPVAPRHASATWSQRRFKRGWIAWPPPTSRSAPCASGSPRSRACAPSS